MSRRGKEKIFIAEAQRIIAAELVESLGIQQTQADEVARQATHGICTHFSKQLVYIPAAQSFELQQRESSRSCGPNSVKSLSQDCPDSID